MLRVVAVEAVLAIRVLLAGAPDATSVRQAAVGGLVESWFAYSAVSGLGDAHSAIAPLARGEPEAPAGRLVMELGWRRRGWSARRTTCRKPSKTVTRGGGIERVRPFQPLGELLFFDRRIAVREGDLLTTRALRDVRLLTTRREPLAHRRRALSTIVVQRNGPRWRNPTLAGVAALFDAHRADVGRR